MQMVKNPAAAFIYRICAMVLAISGLITGSGFGTGIGKWFFYTQQSNLLITGLFFYLALRTGIDLIKTSNFKNQISNFSGFASQPKHIANHAPAATQSPCYCPRLQMASTMMISFTLLVFWFLLAPFAGAHGVKLWTYGNLAVHVFTPLAAIGDYVLFCEPGHLKKRDILLALSLPVANLTLAALLGLCGIVYYVENGINHYFPYYFMDFYLIGWLAVVFLSAISFAYFLCAVWIYRIDRRRAKINR